MPNKKISLQENALTKKVSEISKIGQRLSNDNLVKPLMFGPLAKAGGSSKGAAVDAVKELNIELAAIAKKMALLNECTAEHLNNILATFEQADTIS